MLISHIFPRDVTSEGSGNIFLCGANTLDLDILCDIHNEVIIECVQFGFSDGLHGHLH